MKSKIILSLLLGIFFLSLASACNIGDIKISSVADTLKDNDEAWNWEDGEDIELEVTVENNIGNRSDFTAEIVFLKDGDDTYLVTNDDHLTETFSISGEDDRVVDFNFKLEEDLSHENYDMFVTAYITDSKNDYCYQTERVVRVNSFDSCLDNSNLTINTITGSDDFEWVFDEEVTVSVEVTSQIKTEEEYELELVFYDGEGQEYEITHEDLIETKEFANETVTFKFDFDILESMDGDEYGLYARLNSDDACAEKKTSVDYKKGKKTLQNYNHISIYDTKGIIISSATGIDNLQPGVYSNYTVQLSNTGEFEEKVRVHAYSRLLGVNEKIVIENFTKDSSRDVFFNIRPNGYNGSAKILFYAEYDYNSRNGGYFERTTDYNHDIERTVLVLAPVSTPVVPVENGTPAPEVVVPQTPVISEPTQKTSPIAIIIAALIVGGLFITGIILYKRYANTAVPQSVPYQ